MKKERHKVIPAVYVILVKDGKILLSRRQNTGYEDGRLSLPSGHVEPNEHPTNAIVRETREEIGIVIDPKDLIHVHTAYRLKTNDSERVDFFFTASKWSGEIENLEPEKCSELFWVSLNSIPDDTIFPVKSVIDAWKKDSYFSED